MRKRIALLLALLLLAGLFPAAYADDAHSVEKREFTVYVVNIDETLTEPFPLYFLDGVDDLPYLEIDDLGELIFFINTEINKDPNYGLSSHYDGDTVSFERENGYTVELDFAQDLIRFTDYNAFRHNSYDTTLIDMSLMTKQEIEWINAYHKKVYELTAPHLTKDEAMWLQNKCKPIQL